MVESKPSGIFVLVRRTSIVKHIQNIYETNELLESATCANFAQVQKEGGRDVTIHLTFKKNYGFIFPKT